MTECAAQLAAEDPAEVHLWICCAHVLIRQHPEQEEDRQVGIVVDPPSAACPRQAEVAQADPNLAEVSLEDSGRCTRGPRLAASQYPVKARPVRYRLLDPRKDR